VKLYLRAHGLAAEFHDYDWRLPVRAAWESALAERGARRAARAAIVAHSMGGLVARAALALAGTGNVERLVLLGTPHCGSFAAVQAVRGTYAVVRKVARLAGEASAESWPRRSSAPFRACMTCCPHCRRQRYRSVRCARMACLRSAAARGTEQAALAARQRLAPPDERFASIVGVVRRPSPRSRGATTTSSTRSRATATAPCRRRAPRSRRAQRLTRAWRTAI